jgi:stage V sporulation protein G
MQITNVRVCVVNKESKMKAVASVTFDDSFVVHDMKVIEGEKGLFVAMPSKRIPSGDFRDIAHPIHMEMRSMLQEAILAEYEVELEKPQDEVLTTTS